MICRNCGSEIPEGKLYCQFCGEEVQLVPEYSSVDMQRLKKRLEMEELEREERARRMEAEAREQKKRMKPWMRVLCVLMIAVIALALSASAWYLIRRQNLHNAAYLEKEAQRAASEGRTDDALAYLDQAIEVKEDHSADLSLKKAALLVSANRLPEAVDLLEVLYVEYDSSERVLRALLDTLDQAGENQRAAELVRRSKSEAILRDYAVFLAEPPKMSLTNGNTYAFGTMLSMTAEGEGVIYYTKDGSVPDERSYRYVEPILLDTGTNRIKAVYINTKGVASRVTASVYNVKNAVV